jgi:hypothetical protein
VQQEMESIASTLYQLSIWSKGDGSHQPFFYLQDVNNGFNTITQWYASAANYWTNTITQFPTPSDCTNLQLRLDVAGYSGTVQYDNVSIKQILGNGTAAASNFAGGGAGLTNVPAATNAQYVTMPVLTNGLSGNAATATSSVNSTNFWGVLSQTNFPAVLASVTVQESLGAETIGNPGFETLGANPPVFASWTQTNGSGGSISPDTSDPQSGTYDAKLIGAGAATTLSQTITVTGSTLYKFSIWSRDGGVINPCYYLQDVNNGYNAVVNGYGPGNSNWEQQVWYFTTAPNCTSLQLVLSINSYTGTVYYDNISLKPVLGSGLVTANHLAWTGQGALSPINIWTNTASGTTYWTNNTGYSAQVHVGGGTVSAVSLNYTTLYTSSNVGPLVSPGGVIGVSYSSAPTLNMTY